VIEPAAEEHAAGEGIEPAAGEAAALAVVTEVVQDIPETRSHLARRAQGARMIPIREYRSAPPLPGSLRQGGVDAPGARDRESLHTPRQRFFVVSLHDQMNVAALDRYLTDSAAPLGPREPD
jgi:hypothetical protein